MLKGVLKANEVYAKTFLTKSNFSDTNVRTRVHVSTPSSVCSAAREYENEVLQVPIIAF